MAIEFDRQTVGSGYNLSKINTNFQRIENALDGALSRFGAEPNTMEADFDLNGNDLLNGGSAHFDTLVLNGSVVTATPFESGAVPAGGVDGQVLTKQSSTDFDSAWEDIPDAANITTVSSRTALKALSTTEYQAVTLNEGDRSGQFVWRSGDFATLITADTQEAIYIKADAIASTAGAWVRVNWSEIDPRWFGVAVDVASDQNTAMQACFDLTEILAVPIKLPSGRIQLSTRLDYDGGLAMSGTSTRDSELYWVSSSGSTGIDVDLGSSGGLRQTCQLRSLSLLTATVGTGTAISIQDATPLDRVNPSVMIRDVLISGATNPNNDGWHTGILTDGCQAVFIDSAHIWGRQSGSAVYTSQYGIRCINAIANSPHPTEAQITNSVIKQLAIAIHVDDIEGFVASGNQIVSVNTGIEAIGLLEYPDVRISDNYINADLSIIVIDKMYEATISGNLLYNQLQTATATGIEIKGAAKFFNIYGNTFENYSTDYATTSVKITSGSEGRIAGNIFRRSDANDGSPTGTGISLTAGSSKVVVSDDNIFSSEVATKISNLGTSNKILFDKGLRVIAASAVASTTLTGTAAETTLTTVTVPGNSMGANGVLIITTQWKFTGTANTKQVKTKFGGTIYGDVTNASAILSHRHQVQIANRNSTSSQVGNTSSQTNFAGNGTTVVTSAIDTTADQNIVFTGQLVNTADSITLESYTIELLLP